MSSNNIIKERINAVINSQYRLNPNTETGSNFTYSFSKNISRISSIIIKSVQIPFTFYGINSTNNVLTFNSGAVVVTIPIGNYTTQTLGIALTTAINTAFADTTTSVSYDVNTFKFTITRGTSFIIDAVANVPASTASTILGFHTTTTNAVSATSDSAVNLSGPNYITINSTFLTKPVQSRILFANNNYTNTLVTIPSNVSPGDIITYSDSQEIEYGYKYSIKTTDIIDITIRDDMNNIIDLNGSNIAIQLILITE